MIFNTFLYGGTGDVTICEINCLEQMFSSSLITTQFNPNTVKNDFLVDVYLSKFTTDLPKRQEFDSQILSNEFSIIPIKQIFISSPLVYEFEPVDLVPN